MTNNRKALRLVLLDSFETAKSQMQRLGFEEEPMSIFVKELNDVTSVTVTRGSERWHINCYAGEDSIALYNAINTIAERSARVACGDEKYSAGIRSLLIEFSDDLKMKLLSRLEGPDYEIRNKIPDTV